MFKFPKSKKGQMGSTTALVVAIGFAIVGIIIALVIVATVNDADLLDSGRSSNTAINESGAINATGYTLAHYADLVTVDNSFTLVVLTNATDGTTIASGNYSISSGVVTNASAAVYPSVNITYTFNNYTTEELSADDMSLNFTAGIDEVSAKIPTILLVAIIVLILGVFGIIFAAYKRLNLGSGI